MMGMERPIAYAVDSQASAPMPLTLSADRYRADAYQEVSRADRSENGQFFTSPATAQMMAAFFDDPPLEISLLDAGAGIGTLTAAFVENTLAREHPPRRIQVTAYELEEKFRPYLEETLETCGRLCREHGVDFSYTIKTEDFIEAATAVLRPRLLEARSEKFNYAILNPPYKKIHSASRYRRLLQDAGIETVNLYTAFLALTIGLLESGGQLVAITPRSFCNGPYYKPFRQLFDSQMALRRIHLFESRSEAFAEDDVLQENIIFHAVKKGDRQTVTITSSLSPEDAVTVERSVAYQRVINPQDPHLFIHITASELDQLIADRIELFPCTLVDLGIDVSTGRVVDFRVQPYLRQDPEENTVPLIYPHHMQNGFIEWPQPKSRKPNALVYCQETAKLLLPSGHYVIMRRFSSKEEARRINPALYDPQRITAEAVAFENHVNVYHAWNRGLSPDLARGLTVYLSSTLLDVYFRQFNGHTQVNATDLRSLLYPRLATLLRWGAMITNQFPDQETIDALIESELQTMAKVETSDPVAAKKRVEQALHILVSLGLPRAQ